MKPLPVLLPLGWMYRLGMALRNLFFDMRVVQSRRIDVPVISVGNMTSGGTGKTPIVELIVKTLERLNVRAAVVSRGYGRRSRGMREVSTGNSIASTVQEAGDEAFQLATRLPGVPVVVDEDRVRGAEHAVKSLGARAVVLDDGFQHRRMHRDLDIVLIDVSRSPFRTAMLPAGYLREPLGGLRRADVVIFTRIGRDEDQRDLRQQIGSRSKAAILTSSYRITSFRRAKSKFSVDLSGLKGKHVVAFCGIGNPEGFRHSLVELGLVVDAMLEFDDHRWYVREDLDRIVEERKKLGSEYIVTTEKDFVRLSYPEYFDHHPFFYVEGEAEVHEPELWDAVISRVLEGRAKR